MSPEDSLLNDLLRLGLPEHQTENAKELIAYTLQRKTKLLTDEISELRRRISEHVALR